MVVLAGEMAVVMESGTAEELAMAAAVGIVIMAECAVCPTFDREVKVVMAVGCTIRPKFDCGMKVFYEQRQPAIRSDGGSSVPIQSLKGEYQLTPLVTLL